MIKLRQAIVVEGRYDKNALCQLVDAPVIETHGFGVMKDRRLLGFLRQVAAARGLIILTDSDGAGFVIRNFLKGALPPEQVLHAYIPDVPGKERRKRAPGREGKLGVEGMPPEVLLEALRRAGAQAEDSLEPPDPITKTDLWRTAMIDISVNELVKSFEVGQTLLDGLSFDIHEGECVGIMGRNGCGKTTLFRLLTGELSPDSGEIHIAAGKKLGLISQIPVYPAGFSVEDVLRTAFIALASLKRRMEELEKTLEKDASRANLSEYDRLSNAYLTGGGYEQDTEVDKVCNGLGIPAEMRGREFDRLSGGEKTRVNLARLLLEKTDILLLDEPTNHLDLRSVEWLEDYIRHFKGTVLTISHDRYFLDQVVQRIIEISAGKAEFYTAWSASRRRSGRPRRRRSAPASAKRSSTATKSSPSRISASSSAAGRCFPAWS